MLPFWTELMDYKCWAFILKKLYKTDNQFSQFICLSIVLMDSNELNGIEGLLLMMEQ